MDHFLVVNRIFWNQIKHLFYHSLSENKSSLRPYINVSNLPQLSYQPHFHSFIWIPFHSSFNLKTSLLGKWRWWGDWPLKDQLWSLVRAHVAYATPSRPYFAALGLALWFMRLMKFLEGVKWSRLYWGLGAAQRSQLCLSAVSSSVDPTKSCHFTLTSLLFRCLNGQAHCGFK